MQKLTEILSDESKWIKGIGSLGGRVCLSYAIMQICQKDHSLAHWGNCVRIALDSIREVYPDAVTPGNLCIWRFNDDPRTTFEMVQRVCEEFDRRRLLTQQERDG